MARKINLREYVDMTVGSIPDDVADLILSIETAMWNSIIIMIVRSMLSYKGLLTDRTGVEGVASLIRLPLSSIMALTLPWDAPAEIKSPT